MNTMNTLHRHRGFTLVEVMITTIIVMVAAMSVLGAMMVGVKIQQSTRELNGANRVAVNILETTKRALFVTLAPQTYNVVLIDNRGTGNTGDDVTGTARLQFFKMNGTEVGVTGSPIPLDKSMIRAQVTVTWTPAGRRGSTSLTLSQLLAP